MHGGQAVPNFDYAMAEGVACTFRKEYYDAVQRYFWLEYDCENVLGEPFRNALKTAMPERINMSNIDSYEEAFVQWVMKEGAGWMEVVPKEEDIRRCHKTSIRIAMKETDLATYQAMESLVHNLNTMNSRAGAQVPFSSINLYQSGSANGYEKSSEGDGCRTWKWRNCYFPGTDL